jgi:hypothetical protein
LPHRSHADQLVNISRNAFEKGDSFMQKITGTTTDRPSQRIREFRNRPFPVARLYVGIVIFLWACSPGPPTATPVAVVPSYSTNFNLTENPISEGGNWVGGKAVGLDWNNPLSAAGKAYASVLSGLSGRRYDDSVAHLNASFLTFNANQYAQGTVYRVPGYSPAGSKHEVELLLRFQITAHHARGYEVLWGHGGDFAIVRWNGLIGDYKDLGFTGPGPGTAVDGDVLRAEIIGDVIRVFKNGSLVGTGPSDTMWTDGQPGMGFWPVDSSAPVSYGWKNYEAGNL